MKPTTKLRLALSFAFVAGSLAAQQPVAPSTVPAASCQIKRSVLTNGDLQIQNADCSVRVVHKVDVTAAPQEHATGEPGPPAASAPILIQPEKPDPAPAEKARASASKATNAIVRPPEIKPEPLPEGEDDPTLRARYRDSMIGYYDYHTAGYRHRQRVFEWQFISSIVIFVLVVLLVSSGVYFAAIQFNEGMRRRAAALTSTTATTQSGSPALPADDTVTTFSASATGITVSSPVLGVIILVISLAFFYLYLVYVYPISELF